MANTKTLRAEAIGRSLPPDTTLRRVVHSMGFVQADPIRAPARAQDLILRQRVKGYRVGDLDRAYARLELEEDMLYAYGFMPRATQALLHPRGKAKRLVKLERDVLAAVAAASPVHPRDLDAEFGRKRVRNAWGGHSQATKRALEALHRRGLLRVAGRRNGVRLYELASPGPRVPADERLRRLAQLVTAVFAPAPESFVRSVMGRVGSALLEPKAGRRALADALQSEALIAQVVDGVRYLSPNDGFVPEAAVERVRFLAPFDPLVHDRQRFEHLWGWAYRFEAYTPVAKRVRGYYAMPLVWRDRVIGWANASNTDGLHVELGYVSGRAPRGRAFRNELEAEVERLRAFLKPRAARSR